MRTSDNQNIAIKSENITKTFGDFTAVDHISFEVTKGEIFGFLGANGAGKTTAMRMFSGLSIPTSGTATVAGFDVLLLLFLIIILTLFLSLSPSFSFGLAPTSRGSVRNDTHAMA